MKISPTDFIDFTEIGNDSRFEKFVGHFLEDMGYDVDRPPAYGPDRKRDLVVSERVRYSKRGFRWLVSCKYYSGRVGQDNDKADLNKLIEHDCDGFMFVYSSEPTNSLLDSVETVCERKNKPYKFFTGLDVEKALLSYAEHTGTFRQYFPKSFERISLFKNNPRCESKYHEVYEFGEPLFVLCFQRKSHDLPQYKMICDECIRDLYRDFDREFYSWHTTVLIKEFYGEN